MSRDGVVGDFLNRMAAHFAERRIISDVVEVLFPAIFGLSTNQMESEEDAAMAAVAAHMFAGGELSQLPANLLSGISEGDKRVVARATRALVKNKQFVHELY
jgi:hypothetical protein